ncbi:MAG: hypothetical protein QM610_12335 [Chitinophagaceae bacterium]
MIRSNVRILTCAVGLAVIGMMASCSKENVSTPESETTPGSNVGDSVALDTVNGTKGYLVTLSDGYGARNFHQGTEASTEDTNQWADPASTYYYLLSSNDGGDSSDWDFKFSGTANANFTVNTTKYTLSYVNTSFDSVTLSTTTTAISSGIAGYNSFSGTGSSTSSGWYIYNISTHIMSSYQSRTYVLTPVGSGSTWKIKLRSVYWNETPNASYAATNYPFMSFDYAKL